MDTESDFPWHLGIYDAHCHPTDTMSSLDSIWKMKAKVLTIMATRFQDQELVHQTAIRIGFHRGNSPDQTQVVPSFGFHPWFSYQLFDDSTFETEQLNSIQILEHYKSVLTPAPSSKDEAFLNRLPKPMPLTGFVKSQREHLLQHPLALVGEVGIDKAFRLPEVWQSDENESRDQSVTPGGREGRRLSPFRVNLEHQGKIFTAQLRLAGELQRPVSAHGVQAHGALLSALQQLCKDFKPLSKRQKKQLGINRPGVLDEDDMSDSESPKPYPPRICLHSFSGPPEAIAPWFKSTIPSKVFVSFSTGVNFSTSAASKAEEVIKWLPEDRILIESDLHTAGPEMDQRLEDITRKICRLRQWNLDVGVTRLAKNWELFVLGEDD
jgi:Tat protein secretion system quality control protein TatD with DNase activity